MARTEPNLDIMIVVQIVRDAEGCCIVAALSLAAVHESAQMVVRIEAV